MAQGPIVFDRDLLRARRARAEALGPATFLLERVAADVAERLSTVLRRFSLAADLGTPGGELRRALSGADTVVAMDTRFAPADAGGVLRVAGDLEALPFGDSVFDIAVSGLALQFVNDLPGTLAQIRRALKPDGLFMAALVGGSSLGELRESFAAAEAEVEDGVSPRVAPFVDVRELGALLQRAGFALPVTDVDRIVVRYASPLDLMHDLRRMGATNALVERRRKPLRRATLKRMMEIYGAGYADADGRVRATFEIVWLSGWAPHESQQKPLAPGSARTRLADALGTREISTGEKTGRLGAGRLRSVKRVEHALIQIGLHRGAQAEHGGRDGDADTGRDHAVFDRARAALVAQKPPEPVRRGRKDQSQAVHFPIQSSG